MYTLEKQIVNLFIITISNNFIPEYPNIIENKHPRGYNFSDILTQKFILG